MDRDYLRALRLDGKGYIVLGVGEGFGRRSCHALAQAGAELLCVDLDPAVADETAAALGGIAHAADATDRGAMEGVFAAAQRHFGDRLAGVVDVVGMSQGQPLPEYDDAAIERQFDIVLHHALLTLQLGGPALARNGGGSLTFIGSMAGIITVPGSPVYGIAKAALHHAVRYAAVEYGPQHVRVNAIAPGYARTPRLLARYDDEVWASTDRSIPLGRAADPAEIAGVVLFLASELACYVTGNVILLDGAVSHTINPR
jgi:NAD(P)-dependent dehydrogenase (short-subunit alcohol dehydrogenase family)